MAPRNLEKLAKKNSYLNRLRGLVETVPNILIIHADHVGSRQMQEIRIALRGRAVVLMGKNTMIRTALRMHQEETGADMEGLIGITKGNIGFVFCIAPIEDIRKVITENRVPAMAKAGAIAPVNVDIPAGPTSLDPSQTNFFQALNIATKIVKGSIEISSDVALITKGLKVTASQQALLMKLGVRPFAYGLEIHYVCDNGSVFDAAVLDISDADLIAKFMNGVRNVAAFSREAGYPTEASLPYAITNAFKNCAALCADIEYTFPEIEQLKEFLKDPSKFASAAPAAAAAGGGDAAKPAAAAAVEEEEEEGEMDFDLFD